MSCKIPVSNTGPTSHKKPYDPLQFTEKAADSNALKEAHHKLKLLEFDYKALHDKRLQDVRTQRDDISWPACDLYNIHNSSFLFSPLYFIPCINLAQDIASSPREGIVILPGDGANTSATPS